jgi:hypothetical protein
MGGALSVAGAVLLLLLDQHSDRLLVTLALVLIGAGTGVVIPGFIIGLQNAVPNEQAGVSMGVVGVSRGIGATLGATVVGALVTSGPEGLSAEALLPRMQVGFTVALVGSIIMLAMGLALRDLPLRTS